MKQPTWLQMARQHADRHRRASGRVGFSAETAGNRGQLFIYDVIGQDFWTGEGVTAKRVADALDGMKAVSGLDIFMNSPGGDIFEAKAIYAQLNRFQAEKVVHVDGIAASAATFIAMAGDRIITAPAATWMIHEVRASAWGVTAEEALKLATVLDMENKVFADTYAKRTGQPGDQVASWMAAETWMNAAQAKERGFTDEIANESSDGGEALAAALQSAISTLRALRGR